MRGPLRRNGKEDVLKAMNFNTFYKFVSFSLPESEREKDAGSLPQKECVKKADSLYSSTVFYCSGSHSPIWKECALLIIPATSA